MGLDNALYKFKLLTGFDDAQANKWIPVIRESLVYVKSLVDLDSLSEEEISCVEKSAGVYSFYQYAASLGGREASFSAGDLSVHFNNAFSYAKTLWESEYNKLSAFRGNSKFLFKRV